MISYKQLTTEHLIECGFKIEDAESSFLYEGPLTNEEKFKNYIRIVFPENTIFNGKEIDNLCNLMGLSQDDLLIETFSNNHLPCVKYSLNYTDKVIFTERTNEKIIMRKYKQNEVVDDFGVFCVNDIVYIKQTNFTFHNPDGPAVMFAGGTKKWMIDGQHHRMDGPAIEHASGRREYWVNNKPLLIAHAQDSIQYDVNDLINVNKLTLIGTWGSWSK